MKIRISSLDDYQEKIVRRRTYYLLPDSREIVLVKTQLGLGVSLLGGGRKSLASCHTKEQDRALCSEDENKYVVQRIKVDYRKRTGMCHYIRCDHVTVTALHWVDFLNTVTRLCNQAHQYIW